VWVGAVLAVALLLAESFAATHPLDAAAHTNGQPCSVCVSAASLGAGAVAVPAPVQLDVAMPVPAAGAAPDFVSLAIHRRFARGPPIVSFVA
jgi:hypothetical protein